MRLTFLSLLVVAGLCAPASAATVSYSPPTPESPGVSPEESCSRYGQCPIGRTTFTAAAGEANRVTVVAEGAVMVFRDAGAPVTAGPGCTARPEGAATCPMPADTTVELGDGADDVTAAVGVVVRGGDGDDVLRGSRVEGGAGNDTVVGGDAGDRLDGGPGLDVVTGGPGDDEVVDADAERDRLDAGDGIDVLSFDGRADGVRVDLGARPQVAGENEAAGFERVFGGAGPDELLTDPAVNDVPLPVAVGGAGDDRLEDRSTAGLALLGGIGDDTLVAGAGSSELNGEDGDDTLDGGEGDDTLLGEAGADTLRAGAGRDEVRGGRGRDAVAGGDGNDRLLGESGVDRVDGEAGADVISGGADGDVLRGGDGADRISGASGDDLIEGGARSDQLSGGAGADRLLGGAGMDELFGGTGPDRLDGGDGDDRLFPEDGADRVAAGPGADHVSSVDRSRDRIACGAGNDMAVHDARDRPSSCERRRLRSVRRGR